MTLWYQVQHVSPCSHNTSNKHFFLHPLPSGRGSSVFVLFLLQKKLIPWLCAIGSFIFYLIVAQLCRVEAAIARSFS